MIWYEEGPCLRSYAVEALLKICRCCFSKVVERKKTDMIKRCSDRQEDQGTSVLEIGAAGSMQGREETALVVEKISIR